MVTPIPTTAIAGPISTIRSSAAIIAVHSDAAGLS